MKKSLLSLFTLIGLSVSAQTITQSYHFPVAGNTYTTVQCDSIGITGGTITGSGVTWNYAPTTHTAATKNYYAAPVITNTTYPSATISVGSATNNVSYYSTDGAKFYYWGGNLLAKTPTGNIDLNLKYTSPAVHMAYSASLSTTTSQTVAGTTSLGNFTGNSQTNVDGTGSLILPAKTFTDVVRVKTTENFTIVTAFGNAIVDKIKFDYYSISASRYPIFTIDSVHATSLAGSDQQKFVTVQKDYEIVGINESQKSAIELSVFPNPASNLINFSTTSMEATKVIALDITGKVVATETMEMGKAKMNLSNIASGVYIYHVLDKNNQILKSDKFNVNK